MKLDEYQMRAESTAIYPDEYRILYPTLGLSGEAGEVADKVKKIVRDGEHHLFYKDDIAKELGDVLWYVAILARDLGYSLEEIAQTNLDKLEDRKNRNMLKGSGDDR
jgi:NTP pyrophosphatase (non-canonical NTP hydrolase)